MTRSSPKEGTAYAQQTQERDTKNKPEYVKGPPPLPLVLEEEAPKARARRLENLVRYLPLLCGLLRTTSATSPGSARVPGKCFCITLVPQYSEAERRLSGWAQQSAPGLFRQFLEADVNLLCRDTQIAASDIKAAARVKEASDIKAIA